MDAGKKLLPWAADAAGGVLGYFAFFFLIRHRFYALILPGSLIGFGSGLVAKNGSAVRAAICAVAALLLGFFCEWKARPFNADESLGYFVTHLHRLGPVTWALILV